MMRPRLVTVWLDGCSGCHMSLLDLDERALDLAVRVDVLMSPLVDAREIPDRIDLAVVEGAVSSEADLEKIRAIRARSRILLALGDCAVTANVPVLRRSVGADLALRLAYLQNADLNEPLPREAPLPLPQSRPIHEFVRVDRFLRGCPPPPDAIWEAIVGLLTEDE